MIFSNIFFKLLFLNCLSFFFDVFVIILFLLIIRIEFVILINLFKIWFEIKKVIFFCVFWIINLCIFCIVFGFKLFIGLFKIMNWGLFKNVIVIFNFCFILREYVLVFLWMYLFIWSCEIILLIFWVFFDLFNNFKFLYLDIKGYIFGFLINVLILFLLFLLLIILKFLFWKLE